MNVWIRPRTHRRRNFFLALAGRGRAFKPTLARHDQVRRSTDRLLIIEDDVRVLVVTLQFGKKFGQAHGVAWRGRSPHGNRSSRRLLKRRACRRDRRNLGARLRKSRRCGARSGLRAGGRIARVGSGRRRCDSLNEDLRRGGRSGARDGRRHLRICRLRDAGRSHGGASTGVGVGIGPAGAGFLRLQIGDLELHRAVNRDVRDTFSLSTHPYCSSWCSILPPQS